MDSPVFPNVTITFDNGKQMAIAAPSAYPDNLYVPSPWAQGKDTSSSWLPIELLADGTNVELTMGPVPNEAFGAKPNGEVPEVLSLNLVVCRIADALLDTAIDVDFRGRLGVQLFWGDFHCGNTDASLG